MTTTPAIEINDLTVMYNGKRILDRFSLTVPHNESIVLIGPSGAGKTTLLQCILGLEKPLDGQIKINGKDITQATGHIKKNIQRQIGMVFQNSALFDSLTIWENVTFGLRAQRKISNKQARHEAINYLAQVGLDSDIRDLFPADLSGGMQKRVGLARTIATSPEIILFDEPTTGLDPIMSTVINQLIARIARRPNTSTLTITHDMTTTAIIASQVAMLYEGKIIWQGDAKSLLKTNNPYVHQFVHGDIHGPLSDSSS